MERELVRCGCGVTRNPDEDALSPVLELKENFEPARVCRQCGCVYQLPLPVEAADTERPPAPAELDVEILELSPDCPPELAAELRRMLSGQLKS